MVGADVSPVFVPADAKDWGTFSLGQVINLWLSRSTTRTILGGGLLGFLFLLLLLLLSRGRDNRLWRIAVAQGLRLRQCWGSYEAFFSSIWEW